MVKDPLNYSVIVADDDQNCRETLCDILVHRGFKTYPAENGHQVIEIVEKTPIDLGFLDYQMPDMTGLETLKIIREINPVLQCVMVSGAEEPSLQEWAVSLGALSLLHKPVHLNSILQVLELMIDRSTRAAQDPSRLPKDH